MNLNQVTQYCQSFLNRIRNNSNQQSGLRHLPVAKSMHVLSINGTLIYHVEQRGFFSIKTDDGQEFFPINLGEFEQMHRDRQRVRVTLEYYPDMPNFFRHGVSARLIYAIPISL